MRLTDRLQHSDLLDQWVTANDLAETLGITPNSVRSALDSLYQRGFIRKVLSRKGENVTYRKHGVHWVFKIPLSSNPPKCFGERMWV